MRALAWRGVEEWLAEHAQVDLDDDGVFATGVQLGVEPEPYLVEYLLDVPERLDHAAPGGRGVGRRLAALADPRARRRAAAGPPTASASPTSTARWTATSPSHR